MPGSPDFLDIGDQLMKSGELDILLNINMIRGTGTKEQHEYIRLFGKLVEMLIVKLVVE